MRCSQISKQIDNTSETANQKKFKGKIASSYTHCTTIVLQSSYYGTELSDRLDKHDQILERLSARISSLENGTIASDIVECCYIPFTLADS